MKIKQWVLPLFLALSIGCILQNYDILQAEASASDFVQIGEYSFWHGNKNFIYVSGGNQFCDVLDVSSAVQKESEEGCLILAVADSTISYNTDEIVNNYISYIGEDKNGSIYMGSDINSLFQKRYQVDFQPKYQVARYIIDQFKGINTPLNTESERPYYSMSSADSSYEAAIDTKYIKCNLKLSSTKFDNTFHQYIYTDDNFRYTVVLYKSFLHPNTYQALQFFQQVVDGACGELPTIKTVQSQNLWDE